MLEHYRRSVHNIISLDGRILSMTKPIQYILSQTQTLFTEYLLQHMNNGSLVEQTAWNVEWNGHEI